MGRKDQLLRILAALDGHFDADEVSPADQDRWKELKRHIVRMKDGIDMARIEVRGWNDERARVIERHLNFGLGEPTKQ